MIWKVPARSPGGVRSESVAWTKMMRLGYDEMGCEQEDRAGCERQEGGACHSEPSPAHHAQESAYLKEGGDFAAG